jgi:hypothetical protein
MGLRRRGEETRAISHQEDSHHGVQRGRSVMTPEGHPARSDPGQNVGPDEAVVLMRRTRAYFIKARTQLWSTERPDIYTQPCFYLVHHVTLRRCREGWVHI